MIEYSILLKKLNNSLNEEEEIEFSEWINSSLRNRNYFKRIEKAWNEDNSIKDIDVNSAIENFDHFVEKLNRSSMHFYIKRIVSSAAVLILLFGLYILLGEKPETPKHYKKYIAKNQIVPGCKKAIIIANDSIIYLNNKTNNSNIIVKGDTIHSSKGMVSYKENNKDSRKNTYSTIVVPRGGEYSLQLADGTKVYLNADSKLKFPTSFSLKERRVVLNGEAYFEVAHNDIPFIVQTRLGCTKVYGTQFDVKCYSNEKVEKVTLIKGKVGYSSNNFDGETVLKPGEQISYSGNVEKPTPYKVNINNVVLWKENKLKFEKASLEDIMSTLSRWYDFDIKYQNDNLKKLIFTGRLNKYENINKFLNLFKETTKIEFDIVDKTIFVRQRY